MPWTTLINSLFLPGKKILGATGMALRDNPIAIAQGDTGAPRILLPALERLVVGNTTKNRSDALFSTACPGNKYVDCLHAGGNDHNYF